MASLSHLLLYFFLFSFFLITGLASSNSSFLSGNLLFLPSFCVCVCGVFDMFIMNSWITLIWVFFFFFWFNVADEIFESRDESTGRVLLQAKKGITLISFSSFGLLFLFFRIFFFMLIGNATEKWKMCSNFCRCRFSFLDFSLISVSHCRLMSEILTDIMALIPNKWCNIFLLSVSVSFPTS